MVALWLDVTKDAKDGRLASSHRVTSRCLMQNSSLRFSIIGGFYTPDILHSSGWFCIKHATQAPPRDGLLMAHIRNTPCDIARQIADTRSNLSINYHLEETVHYYQL